MLYVHVKHYAFLSSMGKTHAFLIRFYVVRRPSEQHMSVFGFLILIFVFIILLK